MDNMLNSFSPGTLNFIAETSSSFDEVNLIKELIKNPFDEAFKKATDNEELLELGDGVMITTDTLNTPNPLFSNSPNILNLLNEEIISREKFTNEKNIQSYQINNAPKIAQSKKKVVSIRPAPMIPQITTCENISINNSNLSHSNVQYVPIYVTALQLPIVPNIENNVNVPRPITTHIKDVKQILKERINSTKIQKSIFPNIYFPSKSIKTVRKEKSLQTRKEESNSRSEILERNREASARCRYKKKIQLQNMSKQLFEVQKQNKILQKEIRKLKKMNEDLLNENVLLKNFQSVEFS